MARKAKVTADTPEIEETQDQLLQRLQAENARLKAEKQAAEESLAELGNVAPDAKAMKYMSEVASIRRAGRVDTEKTVVHEFTDHKNISLWTKWGKRIGPLHRENALRTLNAFYAIGVMLSTKQPTQAEVDAWLLSPEGKAWSTNEEKKRDANLKTMKRGELEKILKMMSEQFGLTTEALRNLRNMNEVMSPSEGRKAIGQ